MLSIFRHLTLLLILELALESNVDCQILDLDLVIRGRSKVQIHVSCTLHMRLFLWFYGCYTLQSNDFWVEKHLVKSTGGHFYSKRWKTFLKNFLDHFNHFNFNDQIVWEILKYIFAHYWLKMSHCILVCSIHSSHETIDCFNGFFWREARGQGLSYETLKHTSNYFTLQKIIQLHHGVPVSIITLLFNYKKVFFYEVPRYLL